MPATLRAARPEELPACAAAFGADLRLLRHVSLLAGSRVLVADEGGAPLGIAAAWPRDGLWWVGLVDAAPDRPEVEDDLWRAALEAEPAPAATLARSPRAVAACERHGLHARAEVRTFELASAPPEPPASHGLAPLRRSSLAFERARFGYARGHDHRFLAESGMRGFEVSRADGTRAGFVYAGPGRIGPAALESAEDVAPALALAARAAGLPALLDVPLANEAARAWAEGLGARPRSSAQLMSRAPPPSLDLVVLGPPGLA